jgi:DNA segregation ATPase FtsK/SpoIIIE, S-DNA-T family
VSNLRCRYPEHHKSDCGGGPVLLFVVLAAAAAAVVYAVGQLVAWVVAHLWWFAAPVLAAAVLLAGYNVVRVVQLPPGARRFWLFARWHRFGWHRLSRNLSLAGPDKHLGGLDSPRKPKVVYPRARFRADAHGWVVRVKLRPGVSRAEFEKNADHLANAWRAHRVGITQPGPNRLLVRAMRIDPLAVPLPADVLPPFDGRNLFLGADEWGQRRSASLANLSGSVVGGNPGRGKTVAASAMAVQFAPAPTQWYLLDGKGGGDWSGWSARAAAYAGDNLAAAVGVLEDAHARMVNRLATVQSDLGTRNAWSVGPTRDYPLIWVCVDECHTYLDLESAKAAGRDAERQVRACRMLLGQLLRKGRSVMVHTTLVAQKCTSSSIPTDLRDLAGLRVCFGVATLESGIAVLGEDLRQFESASPTLLQAEEHAGVATARLATGTDPYTRVRFPLVGEDQADAVARDTAHLSENTSRAEASRPGEVLTLTSPATPAP